MLESEVKTPSHRILSNNCNNKQQVLQRTRSIQQNLRFTTTGILRSSTQLKYDTIVGYVWAAS